MDKKDTNTDDGNEEIISISHGEDDSVVVTPGNNSSDSSTTSSDPVNSQGSSGQDPHVSDLTSKYSDEIKKISEGYSHESAVESGNQTQKATQEDSNRGLYSEDFHAPEQRTGQTIQAEQAQVPQEQNPIQSSPENVYASQQIPNQPTTLTSTPQKNNSAYVYQDPSEALSNPAEPLLKEKPNKRKLLPMFALGVLILLAIGSLILFVKETSQERYRLSNGGQTYSFKYYANSTPGVNALTGYNQLTGNSKSPTTIYLKAIPNVSSCTVLSNGVKVVGKVTYNSKTFDICGIPTDKIVIFNNGDNTSMVEIYSVNKTTAISNQTLQNIFNSLKTD